MVLGKCQELLGKCQELLGKCQELAYMNARARPVSKQGKTRKKPGLSESAARQLT